MCRMFPEISENCFPKTVKIAVFINCGRCFLGQEFRMGSFAGIQISDLNTGSGLQRDELNVVFLEHRMIDRADINRNFISVHSNNRYMLFSRSVCCIRFQQNHVFSAADSRARTALYFNNNFLALIAAINLEFLHKNPPDNSIMIDSVFSCNQRIKDTVTFPLMYLFNALQRFNHLYILQLAAHEEIDKQTEQQRQHE